MATRAQKIVGALAAVGAAAYVLWPRRASAASAPAPMPEPVSRTLNYPIPPDGLVWNRYSVLTLNRQREFNARASEDTFYGFPLLVEDGILGPLTCRALTDYRDYLSPPSPWADPIACGDATWRTPQ